MKINDYDYWEMKYNKFLDIKKIIKEKENLEKINRKDEKQEKEEHISLLDIVNSEEVSEYEILQFKKVITTHSNSCYFYIN